MFAGLESNTIYEFVAYTPGTTVVDKIKVIAKTDIQSSQPDPKPPTNNTYVRKVNPGVFIHNSWGYHNFNTTSTHVLTSTNSAYVENAIVNGSGKTIILPAGDIQLNPGMYIPSNIKIIGKIDASGKRLTKISATSSTGTYALWKLRNINNVEIQNIYFDGRLFDMGVINSYGGSLKNALIRNNSFVNVGLGKLEAENAASETIKNQQHKAVSAVNISPGTSTRNSNVTVDGNYFRSIAVHSIGVHDTDMTVIHNNLTIRAGSGMDISSNNHNIEIYNNITTDCLEGYKVVGNGGANIHFHNNTSYDNPHVRYFDPISNTYQESGGAGIFFQFEINKAYVYDNYISGDFVDMKKNGTNFNTTYFKNNRGSNGNTSRLPDRQPNQIDNSKGTSVFGVSGNGGLNIPTEEYITYK